MDVCGPIEVDTTWTPAKVYVIDCQVIVPAGVTLTVLPGTVVKSPGRFSPASITVRGRFVADGTLAAPIVFTSIKDDAHGGDTNDDGSATTPAPGDWPSLNFEAGSIGRLSNVLIAYGGWYYFYEGQALVRCFDADLRLDRVTLRASYEAGVYTRRCKLSITNSTFADNRWHALQLGRWSSGGLAADEPFTLENNHFGPGPAGAVWFDGTPHGPVSIRGNVAVGGTTGLELYGELRNDLDWHNDALPLLLQFGLRVAPEGSLRLAPGSLVKSNGYLGGFAGLEVNGALGAVGTAAAPIVFTSIRDDERGGDTNGDGSSTTAGPGDWSGITVNAGGRAHVAHAEILYGGGYYGGFAGAGLVRVLGGEATLEDVTLAASHQVAVYAENGSVRLRDSRMEGNRTLNVWNATPKHVVDARFNWWGDPSGPRHPTKNPQGLGKDVSDGVLFFPWAVDRDGTVPTQVIAEGPSRVSPGDTVDYAVSYYAGEDLVDAVLTLQLPLTAAYIEDPDASGYWPDRHEAFWHLGSLAPGSGGTRSVRARYRWGTPNKFSDGAVGALRSAEPHDAIFGSALYLAYTPLRATNRWPMSPAEVAGERSDHPDIELFFGDAEAAAFKFLHGTRMSISDGTELTELVFIRPDSAMAIRRVGPVVLRTRVDPATWSVSDRTGRVTYDATTGQMEASGDWATSSEARAAAAAPIGACIGNCLLIEALDESLFASIGEGEHRLYFPSTEIDNSAYLEVVRSPQCLAFYLGSASHEACSAAVRSAVQRGMRPLGLSAVHCSNECRKNPSRYRCEEGEDVSLCLRNGEMPTSLGLRFTAWLWGERLSSVPMGRYQTFRCFGGIFKNIGISACEDGDSSWCAQNWRESSRGLRIPSADCLRSFIGQGSCYTGARPRPRALDGQQYRGDECAPLGLVTTIVRSAHDPNAKSVAPGDVIPGQELTYNVEFENEGEGTAYGVYVLDELSPHLDEATLELNGQGTFAAPTRTILWDIGELAPKGQPGSKGERRFTIRVRSGLPSGTVITNQAVVYFPSVPEELATNTVVNVVQPLAAVPQSLETPYGMPIAVRLNGRDVSGTPLTYAIAEQPFAGTLTGAPPNLTYSPAENFTGQDRFTFTVDNGTSTSRAADVTILVTPSSADRIAPEVLWTYPQDGAVLEEVPADPIGGDQDELLYAPSVLAGFSEAMDEATITAATVEVIGAGGRVVATTAVWDGSLNQAVLLPREPWQDGSYTATVSTGARDASGNALATEYAWSFSIGAAAPGCTGDCDANGHVTVDELVTGVNIALGSAAVGRCSSFDTNASGSVTVEELIQGVNDALLGCSPAIVRTPTPTRTTTVATFPSATPTRTVTVSPSHSATSTRTATASPSRSATATRTMTVGQSPSVTPQPSSPTPQATQTSTPTHTPKEETPTARPSQTPPF